MKSRTKFKAVVLVSVGLLLILVGSLIISSFRKSSIDLYDILPSALQTIPSIIYKISAILFISIGFYTSHRGRKLFKITQDVSELNNDTPFVLYLRPFSYDQDDELKNIGGLSQASFEIKKTVESQVSSALKRVGKVISISNPSLDIQVLGSTKFKANHNDWKQSVENLIKESKIVVITLGITDNVIWEISTTLKLKNSKEFFFINPFHEENFDKRKDFFTKVLNIFHKEGINIIIDIESLSGEDSTVLLSLDEENKMHTSKANFISRFVESMANQTVRADAINWLETNNFTRKSIFKKIYERLVIVFFILMLIVCIWAFYMAIID